MMETYLVVLILAIKYTSKRFTPSAFNKVCLVLHYAPTVLECKGMKHRLDCWRCLINSNCCPHTKFLINFQIFSQYCISTDYADTRIGHFIILSVMLCLH